MAKTGSNSKKSSSSSSKKRGRPSKQEQKKSEINRSWSIVMFAVGILWIGLCFIPGQALWETLKNFTFGIFGTTNYIIGIILIYLAILTATNKPIKWKTVQTVFFVFLSASLIHILQTAFTDEASRILTFSGLFKQAKPMTFSGGWIAGLITLPLIKALGVAPTAVILSLITAVLAMFITDTTPYDIYKKTKDGAEKQKQEMEKSIQESRIAREQARIAKQAEREQYEKAKLKPKKIDFEIDEPNVVDENDIQPSAMENISDVEDYQSTFDKVQENKLIEHTKIEEIMRKLNLTTSPQPEETQQPENSVFDIETIKAKEENSENIENIGNAENSENLENQDQTEPVSDVEVVEYVYKKPPITLFDKPANKSQGNIENELKTNAQLLVDTLDSFGVKTKIIDISRGPAVTRYELQPLAGVKISKITNLADDIALNLAAGGVRIEAPIPNKAAVGIEVPNKASTAVNIRTLFESKEFKDSQSPLSIALGVDIAGDVVVADLTKMPHLLIAGSTGSGKSVCVNSIITSFLYHSSPDDVKLILVDPKVVELAEYNGIPHLLMPVVTEPKKAAGALGTAVAEMEKRYKLFAETGVREIKSYNKLAETREDLEKLPYIAIIIDELADLMMVAGKEVEDYICRIAQKARAAGMHLIVATQRPSVDVITGLIKANIPARIAFAVSSQIDSRTILDAGGAEKLLGMGDMLYLPLGAAKPIRVQGTYVKDSEIASVIEFIKKDYTANYNEEMISSMEQIAAASSTKGGVSASQDGEQRDEMITKAIEVVVDMGQASTSLLQRKLKLGYARAARIMDEMEEMGIIGPYEGSKPRQVLITKNQWLEMMINNEQ